jgi:hypothetical protein
MYVIRNPLHQKIFAESQARYLSDMWSRQRLRLIDQLPQLFKPGDTSVSMTDPIESYRFDCSGDLSGASTPAHTIGTSSNRKTIRADFKEN